MVTAGPALVKHQFALNCTPPILYGQRQYCWIFREVRSAQQAEFIRLVPASIGSPEHSVRSTSSLTTPAHAVPRVPFLQVRITNPNSDQTPAPEPAPHSHQQGTSTDNPQLPLSGLPSDPDFYSLELSAGNHPLTKLLSCEEVAEYIYNLVKSTPHIRK